MKNVSMTQSTACLFTPCSADMGANQQLLTTIYVEHPVRKRQKSKLNLKQPTCLDKRNTFTLERHSVDLTVLQAINKARQDLHTPHLRALFLVVTSELSI